MGRGFLSGIFWGGIVGVAILFVSSQTLERQSLSFPKPEASAVEVPGGSEFDQARPESDPIVPGSDAAPVAEGVAGVAVPEDLADAPPVLDSTQLEVPVPAAPLEAPETLGAAPEEGEGVPETRTGGDAAVAGDTGGGLVAPDAPGAAPETVRVETDAPAVVPAGDAAPEVETREDAAVDTGGAGVAQVPGGDDAPVASDAAGAPQVLGQTDAPAAPGAPEGGSGSGLAWLDRLEDSLLDRAPDAPRAPEVASEPSLPPVGADAPEAAEVPVDGDAVDQAVADALQTPVEPETADAGEPEAEGESLLQPVEVLTERDTDVVINRLPQAGDGSGLPTVRRFGEDGDESADDVIEAADAGEGEADAPAASGPALTAFASAFEAPAGMPLISIILVQEGSAPLSAEVLEALPPYVSFAIDAADPQAAELARAYRGAGREVVMIPALPTGAAPQDIEQALAVNFGRVPEAVAVMDVSGSSFQSDRDAVAQVVDVVASSGHGLITFPRGLNTAHQQAQRAGVPTGLIFRNLDGDGESEEEIGRSLDRAAFRARQDEAVILVGTTSSTMLTALTDWALGSRAETVAIAPVSAALGG